MNVLYSASNGKSKYEIYQSEGSSRYNVRRIVGNNKNGKFIRGYRTMEEARFYVDAQTRESDRRLV